MIKRMSLGLLILVGCGAGLWVLLDGGTPPAPAPAPPLPMPASTPEPARPTQVAVRGSQPASSAASSASAPRQAVAPLPLISRVQSALATQDGKAAMELMLELDVCKMADQLADKAYALAAKTGASGASDPTRDPTFRAIQRHQVQCQALAGQMPTLQAQLLSLAAKQQVRGAAVRLINPDSKDLHATLAELRPQILRDALQGDLASLRLAINQETVGNEIDMQVLARGLALAASDGDSSKHSLLQMLSKAANHSRANSKTALSPGDEAEVAQRAEALRAAIHADERRIRQRLAELLGD